MRSFVCRAVTASASESLRARHRRCRTKLANTVLVIFFRSTCQVSQPMPSIRCRFSAPDHHHLRGHRAWPRGYNAAPNSYRPNTSFNHWAAQRHSSLRAVAQARQPAVVIFFDHAARKRRQRKLADAEKNVINMARQPYRSSASFVPPATVAVRARQ